MATPKKPLIQPGCMTVFLMYVGIGMAVSLLLR